ncbi:hypothetical protein NPIL_143081 [Nephila pilipes]|uniref:Uncharacterized protein n=1 Tax=Nephila pilipes TaxID=299642 RepID=A0A8X6NLN4_NEPPI|nr:hypothetical protein NPIL_143081 [Nephila pilipes]
MASLRCYLQQNKSWVDALPFPLLRLRTDVKEDIGYSSAALLYESPLCLSGEFVTKVPNVPHSDFVQRLQGIIRGMKPSGTATHGNKTSLFQSNFRIARISSSTITRPFLCSQFISIPYVIKHRALKYFDIDINGIV